jgi:vacuolar-type H+-ATPase subunit I/STV1
MFTTEKINRTITILPRDKINKVISSLQEKSICQIKEAETDFPELKLVEDEEKLLNLYTRLEYIRNNLEHHHIKEKKNILKDLFGKKRVVKKKFESPKKKELFSSIDSFLDEIEQKVRNNVIEIRIY